MIEIVSGANVILSTPTGTGKSLVAVAAHAASPRPRRPDATTRRPSRRSSARSSSPSSTSSAPRTSAWSPATRRSTPTRRSSAARRRSSRTSRCRQGADAAVDQVVMDEFHYYGDPDRGWAWQVPLLLLPRAQFVLMSATLGDVTDIAADLSRRTGAPDGAHHRRRAARCRCTSPTRARPCTRPSRSCCETGQAPVYIVHFSQAAAMERAQALSSVRIVSREQRDAIAEAIGGFRFTTAFGRDAVALRARRHRRAPRRHAAAVPPPRRDARPARAAAGHLRHRHARRRHQRPDPHRADHRAREVRRTADAAAHRPRVPPGRRARRSGRVTTPRERSW